MPFKSSAQMKYLFAKKPEIAQEFEKAHKQERKSFKNLPEKANKFKRIRKLIKK